MRMAAERSRVTLLFTFLLRGAVVAGPGGEKAAAAAGRGHLRASRADREQMIDALKAAFVQGRLTKDEFDARIGKAFAARRYADLATVTADIPAGLAGAQPPRKQPRWAMNNAVGWGASEFITPAIPAGFAEIGQTLPVCGLCSAEDITRDRRPAPAAE
jgi:hypothetical protein